MIIENKSDIALVEVWLTSDENKDEKIKTKVKEVIAKYKKAKIKVAIFISGEKNLLTLTENLLLKNKKYS